MTFLCGNRMGGRRASTLRGPRASMAALPPSSVRGGRVAMAPSGKAAGFHGPGKPFELRALPIPEPEPGAVLVRVSLANICGSDLHFWRGDAPLALPPDGWIFGHEMTGRVAALGAGVTT